MNLNSAFEVYRNTRDKGLPTDECIEVLYPLIRERVISVIGKVMRSTPDEGLVVTCTTDVLMAIDQFKGDSKFSTWLETFVRRDCLDELRKDESGKNVHKSFDPVDFLGRVIKRMIEVGDTPDTLLIVTEKLEQLQGFQQHCFDKDLNSSRKDDVEIPTYDFDDKYIELWERIEQRLTDEEKQLLGLDFEGYSDWEIAGFLGISEANTSQKLTRIRQKLKVSGA